MDPESAKIAPKWVPGTPKLTPDDHKSAQEHPRASQERPGDQNDLKMSPELLKNQSKMKPKSWNHENSLLKNSSLSQQSLKPQNNYNEKKAVVPPVLYKKKGQEQLHDSTLLSQLIFPTRRDVRSTVNPPRQL